MTFFLAFDGKTNEPFCTIILIKPRKFGREISKNVCESFCNTYLGYKYVFVQLCTLALSHNIYTLYIYGKYLK